MPMTKLTLNADPELVAEAKRLARETGTSLSAMFGRWVRAALQERATPGPAGPLTSRALGLVRVPEDRSDRELVEEALAEKYERC